MLNNSQVENSLKLYKLFSQQNQFSTIKRQIQIYSQEICSLQRIKVDFTPEKYVPFLMVWTLPDLSRQQLKKGFQKYQHLHTFSLKRSYLINMSLKKALEQITHSSWKKIQFLDCGNCQIGDDGLNNILAYDWEHLKAFDAWNCKISTLANTRLHYMKNLIYLSLSYNQMSIGTVQYLIEHRGNFRQVKDFRISFEDGDISWPLFKKHWKQIFPNLKYLGVRKHQLLREKTKIILRDLKNQGLQLNHF